MMPVDIISALQAAGAAVRVEGDDLVVVGPRNAVSPAMRRAIAEVKPALVAALTRHDDESTSRTDETDKTPVNLTDDDLRDHIEALHVAIKIGCGRGLHRHLARTPAEVVKAILATTGPETPEEETIAAYRRAGEAATLAALIAAYRERLEMLRARGCDVFAEAAALELCLVHPVVTEEGAA